MPVTVCVNDLNAGRAERHGVSAAFPDVCEILASPDPFVPIPYLDIAKSAHTDARSAGDSHNRNPMCVEESASIGVYLKLPLG